MTFTMPARIIKDMSQQQSPFSQMPHAQYIHTIIPNVKNGYYLKHLEWYFDNRAIEFYSVQSMLLSEL